MPSPVVEPGLSYASVLRISRPLYWPQLGQILWGSFSSPQLRAFLILGRLQRVVAAAHVALGGRGFSLGDGHRGTCSRRFEWLRASAGFDGSTALGAAGLAARCSRGREPPIAIWGAVASIAAPCEAEAKGRCRHDPADHAHHRRRRRDPARLAEPPRQPPAPPLEDRRRRRRQRGADAADARARQFRREHADLPGAARLPRAGDRRQSLALGRGDPLHPRPHAARLRHGPAGRELRCASPASR